MRRRRLFSPCTYQTDYSHCSSYMRGFPFTSVVRIHQILREAALLTPGNPPGSGGAKPTKVEGLTRATTWPLKKSAGNKAAHHEDILP